MKTSATLRLMLFWSIGLASALCAVAQNSQVTCTFTVSESVCVEQQAKIIYTGNAPTTAQFTWNFDGATIISGTGQGPFVVKWLSAGEKAVTLTVAAGTESCSLKRLVQVKTSPTVFNLTGVSSTPVTNAGTRIGLNGSQTGVIYTLILNKAFTNISRPGTGSALDFGVVTQPGLYTCMARWDGLECSSLMNGSVTVGVGNSVPCSFTISENACTGQEVKVLYTGTYPATAKYTWNFDGATVLTGTGQGPYIIKWTTPGEKRIYLSAKSGNDSCGAMRLVQIKTAPSIYNLSASNTDPATNAGAKIVLSGSQTGVIYTLLLNKAETKIIRKGTGSALDFGIVTQPGAYTCMARWDGLTCSSLMNGIVNVGIGNPVPCSFTVSEIACNGQEVKVAYTGSSPATAKYLWNFDGATVLSGTGQGPFVVKWTATGEKKVTLSIKSGTDSCINIRVVKVIGSPTVYKMTGGSEPQSSIPPHVGLSGSQTGVLYSLIFNQNTILLTKPGTGSALDFGVFTQPGVYTCKARIEGSDCSTMMEGNVSIGSVMPKFELKICIVTFNKESSRNQIVWIKPQTTAIHHFNIYRETSQNNKYQKIAEVPYASLSSWVDAASEPLVRSYRYKITATDNNQVESPQSPYHKTLHLNVMPGFNCNNLIWNHYEGFEFYTYRIYRKSNNSSAYQLIDSVASNIDSYTDFNAGTGAASYYLEVLRPIPCSPLKSGESVSIISNTFTLLPEGDNSIPDLRFSPNPVREKLSVRFQATQSDQSTYTVTSAEGRIIQQGRFTGDHYDFNFSSYRKGIYIVKIMKGASLSVFKVVKL